MDILHCGMYLYVTMSWKKSSYNLLQKLIVETSMGHHSLIFVLCKLIYQQKQLLHECFFFFYDTVEKPKPKKTSQKFHFKQTHFICSQM